MHPGGRKINNVFKSEIIIDAKIIFSAILNTNGKIADLLINSTKYFDFIAPEFLRVEIKAHYSKISKVSGLTLNQVHESEFQIYKKITFISDELIRSAAWDEAIKLVADVDPKDVSYVSFSKHFDCKIWSGDNALIKGLAKKNFMDLLPQKNYLN